MSERIPSSERLQRKLLANKFPESQAKDKFFLIWFGNESKYSIVEKKNIIEKDVQINDTVTVKGATGRWSGCVVFIGKKEACNKKQRGLEDVLNAGANETESDDEEPKERGGKQGSITKPQLDIEENISLSDDHYHINVAETKNSLEKDLLDEAERVKKMFKKTYEDQQVNASPKTPPHQCWEFKERFDILFKKMDNMQKLLEQSLKRPTTTSFQTNVQTPPAKKTKSIEEIIDLNSSPEPFKIKTQQHSPPTSSATGTNDQEHAAEEFVFNGINLLVDVPARNKKPNLYATALLSNLFADKEMVNACVEPKDINGKKMPLDPGRINLLKKCLKVKYGEKVLDRGWSEIRQSLNQKCLDKLKTHRRKMLLESTTAEGIKVECYSDS